MIESRCCHCGFSFFTNEEWKYLGFQTIMSHAKICDKNELVIRIKELEAQLRLANTPFNQPTQKG